MLCFVLSHVQSCLVVLEIKVKTRVFAGEVGWLVLSFVFRSCRWVGGRRREYSRHVRYAGDHELAWWGLNGRRKRGDLDREAVLASCICMNEASIVATYLGTFSHEVQFSRFFNLFTLAVP